MNQELPDEFSGRWERFWKRTLWVYLGLTGEDGSIDRRLPSTGREWLTVIVLPALWGLVVVLVLQYVF